MYVSVLVLLVATVSFSQSTFMVKENAKVVTIDLVRSGDTSSEVVVLIGSHSYKGSATGMCNYNAWWKLCTMCVAILV